MAQVLARRDRVEAPAQTVHRGDDRRRLGDQADAGRQRNVDPRCVAALVQRGGGGHRRAQDVHRVGRLHALDDLDHRLRDGARRLELRVELAELRAIREGAVQQEIADLLE